MTSHHDFLSRILDPGSHHDSPLETGPGVLETGPGILETGPWILETGPGILETGPGILETRPGILETRHGILDTRTWTRDTRTWAWIQGAGWPPKEWVPSNGYPYPDPPRQALTFPGTIVLRPILREILETPPQHRCFKSATQMISRIPKHKLTIPVLPRCSALTTSVAKPRPTTVSSPRCSFGPGQGMTFNEIIVLGPKSRFGDAFFRF